MTRRLFFLAPFAPAGSKVAQQLQVYKRQASMLSYVRNVRNVRNVDQGMLGARAA